MHIPKNQKGFGAVEIVLIIAILIIASTLGWLYFNKLNTSPTEVESTAVSVQQESTPDKTNLEETNYTYTDYRKDKKDLQGVTVKADSDINKLVGSSKLKEYLKKTLKQEIEDPTTGIKTPIEYMTIDRTYGNYAVGSGIGCYALYGPKQAANTIDILGCIQGSGFFCDTLESANVPAELVDSKCIERRGQNGPIQYPRSS